MIGLLRHARAALGRALAHDGALARLDGLEQVLEAGGLELRHCWDRLARADRRVRELEALLDAEPAAKECRGAWCAKREAKGTPIPGTALCLWCTNREEATRG